jgi:hypothetical protein
VIVIGTRGHGAATIGYIVILASIPLAEGEGAAVLFARQARADGIGGVHILNSSSRKTLRHGYWAVYIGPYKTVSAAEHAASAVHTIVGYGGSYVRELIRFG